MIVEGVVTRITDPPSPLEAALVTAFGKYRAGFDHTVDPADWRAGGLWRADSTVVFGWSAHGYSRDATRWRFG